MICNIEFDNGQPKATAPNGKPSTLLATALQYNSPKKAAQIWQTAYTNAFKSFFGNWEGLSRADLDNNGEPFYSSVTDFLNRLGATVEDKVSYIFSKGLPYSEFERQRINDNPSVQQNIIVNEEKVGALNPTSVNPDFVINEFGVYNKYGYQKKLDPYQVEKDLAQIFGGVVDRNLFDSLISEVPYESIQDRLRQDSDYANKLFNHFQNKKAIPLVDKGLNIANKVESQLIVGNDNTELTNLIVQALQTEITEENLNAIEDEALNSFGIDITGLSQISATRDDIVNLLTEVDYLANNLKDSFPVELDSFIRQRENLLPTLGNETALVSLPIQHAGKNLVFNQTNKTDDTMLSEEGLLKIQDNVYMPVEVVSLDSAYELLVDAVNRNENIIPTKPETFEQIQNYVKSQPDNELTTIYKILNGGERSPQRYYSPQDENISVNKEDFEATFEKFINKEKKKDSDLYNYVLKYFVLTEDGYQLTKPLENALSQIELPYEFEKYAQSINNPELNKVYSTPKQFFTDFDIVNQPNLVPLIKVPYRLVEGGLTTQNTNEEFVRTSEGLFKLTDSFGKVFVYSKVQTYENSPMRNYKDFNYTPVTPDVIEHSIQTKEVNIELDNNAQGRGC